MESPEYRLCKIQFIYRDEKQNQTHKACEMNILNPKQIHAQNDGKIRNFDKNALINQNAAIFAIISITTRQCMF